MYDKSIEHSYRRINSSANVGRLRRPWMIREVFVFFAGAAAPAKNTKTSRKECVAAQPQHVWGYCPTDSLLLGDLDMSRIPPVENIGLPLQEGPGSASMSTLFHIMAHRPELARHSIQLLETAMRSGTVDPKLKELLAIRVSQVNHCFY